MLGGIKLAPLDKWIITKEQSLIEEVTAAYNDYEPTTCSPRHPGVCERSCFKLVCSVEPEAFLAAGLRLPASQVKCRLIRRAAYETLYECLMVTAQLMSPIAPFFSEWLYKNLTDNIRAKAKKNNTPLQYESVHHTLLVKAENEKRYRT
jgi:isoleucyl-tRNA synthetase